MIALIERGAQGPRLDRRRLRAGGGRRAAGAGRAGLRQAQGGPGQGAAVAAGGARRSSTAPASRVATLRGSENNDAVRRQGRPASAPRRTATAACSAASRSGEPIVCRVAIKPTSSLPRPQRTVTRAGEPTEIVDQGPPRPVPAAALRADGRGDGGAGAGRPLAALAGAVWVAQRRQKTSKPKGESASLRGLPSAVPRRLADSPLGLIRGCPGSQLKMRVNQPAQPAAHAQRDRGGDAAAGTSPSQSAAARDKCRPRAERAPPGPRCR